MGWTVGEKTHGQSTVEYVARLYDGSQYEVLAVAVVKLSTAYLAVRDRRTGHVVCGIVLLRFYRGSRAEGTPGEIGVKDLDETMGVGTNDCPERILNLLTPVDAAYADHPASARAAGQWRADCRAYHQKRETVRKRVKPGVKVAFTPAYTHPELDLSTLTHKSRNVFLTDGPYRVAVRLPSTWRDRDLTVIG